MRLAPPGYSGWASGLGFLSKWSFIYLSKFARYLAWHNPPQPSTRWYQACEMLVSGFVLVSNGLGWRNGLNNLCLPQKNIDCKKFLRAKNSKFWTLVIQFNRTDLPLGCWPASKCPSSLSGTSVPFRPVWHLLVPVPPNLVPEKWFRESPAPARSSRAPSRKKCLELKSANWKLINPLFAITLAARSRGV